MKYILPLFLASLTPLLNFGQKMPLCHESRLASLGKIAGVEKFTEKNTNCDPKENREAIRRIESLVKLTGFPMKFNICKGNKIDNAYAAMDSLGNRSIVYDDEFLKKLDSDSLRLESLTVLAHEIGHHLAAHTLFIVDENYRSDARIYCERSSPNYDVKKCSEIQATYLKQCREQELEADRIAGYIMFKYGATIDQISSMYYKIAWNKDDTHDDHPSLHRRIEAVTAGYQLGVASKNGAATKVSIEVLRGTKYDFVIKRLDIIERNKIVKKIKAALMNEPFSIISSNSKYNYQQYSPNITPMEYAKIKSYLNKDFPLHLDNDSVYFELEATSFRIQEDPRVMYAPIFGIHIEKNILKILHFTESAAKIIYKSNFNEAEIGFAEIAVMATDLYRNGMQKQIDSLYK